MISVRKIAHATYLTPDVDAQIEYYTDVLGLGLIAREKDAAYLASTLDHHSVVQDGENRHFHSAFELRDAAHLMTACDYLSLNGYKLLWGPGRHGPSHNLFTYHRAPNGLITELYAQLDIMNEELGHFEPRPWHRDRPQRPKVWESGPDPMNWFGILPSEEIRK